MTETRRGVAPVRAAADRREDDALAPPPSPPSPPTVPVAGRQPSRRVLVGVAVLVVVLAVAAVWLSVVLWHQRAADDDRAAAVSSARHAVLTMTTTDPTRAQQSFQDLTELATGAFAAQLQAQSDGFVRAIQQAGVTSRSTVTEAALVSSADQRATVLVSADSVVQNVQVPAGEPRGYRMLVVLEKRDDAWLVSNLDFVA